MGNNVCIYYLRDTAGVYRRNVEFKETKTSHIGPPTENTELEKFDKFSACPIGLLKDKLTGQWKVVPGIPKVAIASSVDINTGTIKYATASVHKSDSLNFSKRLGRQVAIDRLDADRNSVVFLTREMWKGSPRSSYDINKAIMTDIANSNRAEQSTTARRLAKWWLELNGKIVKKDKEIQDSYPSLDVFARTAEMRSSFPKLNEIMKSLESEKSCNIPAWDSKRILTELQDLMAMATEREDFVDDRSFNNHTKQLSK
jgi:hypothetical protein